MTAPDPKASGGEVTAEDLAHKMYAVYFESLKGSTDDFSPKPGWYNGLPEKFSWLDHETEIAWYAAAKTALASLAAKEAENQSLRQRVEGLSKGLREVQDFIWNLPQESACAAYAVADRLLEGTPYHVTAALSATGAAGKAEKT